MPKKSKKIQEAHRGTLKLTAAEKRLHETFGDDVDTISRKKDPQIISARLEAAVRATINGLEQHLSLLKRADPALLARAVEVFESEGAAAMWLVTAQRFANDKTPLQLAVSRTGRKQIFEALGRVEHGVFS